MWQKLQNIPRGEKLTDLVWGVILTVLFSMTFVARGMTEIKHAGLIALMLATLAYEAYALANSDEKDTLSEGIWRYIPTTPLIPYAFGCLSGMWFLQPGDSVVIPVWFATMGHFFWQRRRDAKRKRKTDIQARFTLDDQLTPQLARIVVLLDALEQRTATQAHNAQT